MSRTSKALKRLGVAGVAVATIGAGVPALIATSAQAATGGATTTLSISPASQEGAAGTCLIYSVTPQNSTGGTPSDTPGQTIQLTATPTGSNQVQFCDPTAPDTNHYKNTTAYTTGTGVTQTTAATTATPNGTVGTTANSTGTQTFGVRSNAPGGATIRAYIGAAPPVGYQAGNPTATATATFTAGGNNQNDITSGGNAAQDAVKTVTATDGTSGPVAAGGQQSFLVQVKNAAGEPVSGVTLSATFGSGSANTNTSSTSTTATTISCVSGGNAAGATTTPAEGSQTGGTVTNNAGYATCSYTANTQGTDTITVYVNQTCGGSSALEACEPSNTVTLTTLQAPNTNPAQARTVALTPPTQNAVPGATSSVTATVTDGTGKPVQNVEVTFYIRSNIGSFTGPTGTAGNACGFTSGAQYNNRPNDVYVGCTNAQGQVKANVRASSVETGQIVVDATIDGNSAWFGSPTNQCGNAAGTPTAGYPAGTCSDTAAVNVAAASPTPSGTATPTPTSTTPAGTKPTLSTSTPDIQPNIQGKFHATGIKANSVYELRCYSRPSTTYFTARTVTAGATDTSLDFTILPGTNTRCYVRPAGDEANASNSVVINVHTSLSLSAYRDGVRKYHFQGTNLPRRSGQLITLYRWARADNNGYCDPHVANNDYSATSSDPNCVAVRTATAFTNDSNVWRIDRTFTGSGQFVFMAKTSANLTNAAGVSNLRLTIIH